MPKIEMPDSSLGKSVRKQAKEYREQGKHFGTPEIAELLDRSEEKDVIGYGVESIVIPVKGQETEVASYTYHENMPPEEAKKVFYVQRIFSTLFPHNFPRFRAAFGSKENEGFTGTIRERVKYPTKEEFTLLKRLRRKVKREEFVKYPFRSVENESRELGFPINLYDDIPGPFDNFMVGADGGEYYVDTVAHVLRVEVFDLDKILAYMKKHNYSDQEKHVVKTCVERLQQLAKAKSEKLSPD